MVIVSDPCRQNRSRLVERCRRLLEQEISFIHAAEFPRLSRAAVLAEVPEPSSIQRGGTDDSPLLSAKEERRLFRRMNYLKYEANRLRSRLDADHPDAYVIAEIENLIGLADEDRAQIVQANLRLVAGLAFRYAGSIDPDELIGEGNLILLKAVDRFDYSRGFRFSTYATHAVQRHFFRLLKRHHRHRTWEASASPQVLEGMLPEREPEEVLNPEIARELMRHFPECLDEREQAIVTGRFGLSSTEEGTLRVVAEQLGLSKERVRQLQLRAVSKLQELALRLKLRPEAIG